MKFRVQIVMGNDAMRDQADVAYALRQMAAHVEADQFSVGDAAFEGFETVVGTVRDRNGNSCGRAVVDGREG